MWDGTSLKAVLCGPAEENINNREVCSTKKIKGKKGKETREKGLAAKSAKQ
jgi:hypothetical protein